MIQGSEEWFAARLGKPSASKTADVMAKIKSGYGASRANYMMELLCQRLTGQREEGYTNAAMQRGTDLEPVARSAYEINTGVMVEECGFILHPDGIAFGASPDGLVEPDGLLEIKCPNTATHIDFLRTGKPEGKYILQMQSQMACADRQWCDFVSFDDRLPEQLQYRCVRINRDAAVISEILTEVRKFLAELDALEAETRGWMSAAA
jgi:putative phage-type endonuclease